jgi:DNA polymerase V
MLRVSGVVPFRRGAPLLVPFYSHRVRGGFPSPAEEHEQTRVDLNDLFCPNPGATYLLTVEGTSVTGLGVKEGDTVVVDGSIEPRDGHIVIARLDGELTVKRLRVSGRGANRVVLLEADDTHPNIPVEGEVELRIVGVVRAAITNVLRK